ncbi:WYL domain-containing protein [Paracoccus sp. PS-1]|uniref:helix-turn-helix transcriptional regulator n=1 Tax=Paracoccus sp. PS1 TaxID=2963938 RepID=UPI00224C6ACF|nr:WYL domain-containing protein [Paracoccus sp. PS1]MDQ7264061.1 WYL domain-containing protein [Paracoccus sp. PS1]CAH1686612.1 WYL domain-containing protein [Hyphomicrobiales bacterium]
MRNVETALKWGVERRLEFIEFRLYWEGGVNRSDIVEAFDVSVPQASKDLTLYQERAPHNAVYDKSAKRYVASSEFQPCFLKPDAGQYLNQLRSVAEGILASSESWIARSPPYAGPPVPARGVKNDTLRTVLEAIRHNEAVEIKYQSLSSDDPRWRWIAPHAIGFDGYRWHVRAFCDVDKTFKDFLLSRVLEIKSFRPSEVSPEDDADWNEYITLEIGPHPDLSESQKRIIGLDYGMRGGRARLRVRKALRYYALRRLGLDTPPEARRPQDQQIVLLNEGGADEDHR